MAKAQQLLARQAPEQLIISDWTCTEFSVALFIKRRMEQLDAAAFAQVPNVFAALVSGTLTVPAVTTEGIRWRHGLPRRLAVTSLIHIVTGE